MAIIPFRARQWLQPILRGAAKINYPWTRLYEELKLVDAVYRKQDMGRDYRGYIDAYSRGSRLKYVSRAYQPGRSLFAEATVGMRKRFKYNVQSDFIDYDGGVYSSRSSFVVSDYALTRGEIEDIVRDRLSDIAVDYDIPNIKTTLTEAWHRQGDSWD